MKNIKIKSRYIIVSCLSVLACLGSVGMTYYLAEVIEHQRMDDFVRMSVFFALSIMIAPISSLLISYYVTKSKFEHKGIIIDSAIQKRMLFVESESYNQKINFLKSYNQEQEIFSFFCRVSEAIAYMLALMFLLSLHLRFYWVILDAVIYLAIALISVYPNVKLSKMMGDFWVKYIQNTRYYNYISDVLSKKEYVEEKKIYEFFDYFTCIFENEFDKAAKANKELGKKRIGLEEKNNFINAFFILFEISFLAILYGKELITIGFFVAVLPFAISAYSKVCVAINGVNGLAQADRFLREENAFLEIEKKTVPKVEKMECAIKLERITFMYPETERIILDDLSFIFEKGKKYAIVGVNGSGKTTLAKVIAGLYEPQKGTASTAGEVAILFQDFVKYPFSVGENVALQKEYDAEKIRGILEVLGMNAKLMDMKKGLESELTNTKADGVNLSGGQWQRLALARMQYISNEIIILDEPTASLDPKIEIEIYREYMKAFDDKTVIFITHRLGYIKDVDEILVLNEGRIAECGKPSDLLNDKSTFFYRLFEEQRSLYEE